MPSPPRLRVAPLLDGLCIVTFVLVGGRNHEMDGVGWFLGVLWPLCVGFFGVALLTKLYTRTAGQWLALVVTWLAGLAVTQVLRGAFTDDAWIGVFTVVAATYLGVTLFGWRAVARVVVRRRARRASRAASPV
jgi:hypothetical protein